MNTLTEVEAEGRSFWCVNNGQMIPVGRSPTVRQSKIIRGLCSDYNATPQPVGRLSPFSRPQ